MSGRISLANVRENPLDFLECCSEEDLLALVTVVEAAQVVYNEWHGGDPRYPEEDDLANALASFDFAEPSS